MSNAAEIAIAHEEFRLRLAPHLAELERRAAAALFRLNAREVCARRARKLRRRGCDVRFMRNTANGKARYGWMPSTITWLPTD